jgi:hypothetical protein
MNAIEILKSGSMVCVLVPMQKFLFSIPVFKGRIIIFIGFFDRVCVWLFKTLCSGDAVWEGLRVYNGGIVALHQHIDRLIAVTKQFFSKAIHYDRVTKNQLCRVQKFCVLKRFLHANPLLTQSHKL